MKHDTHAPLDSVSPHLLSDEALTRLRDAILDGSFAPGQELNQVALAQQLGTSRGTLRSALSKLEEEGLVINVPYRGSHVTDLTPKLMRDLYGLRAALEAHTMRLAVPRCTDDDLSLCHQLVEEMRKVVADGSVQDIIDRDLAFHRHFVVLSDNDMLLRIWSTIQLQLWRYLERRYRFLDLRLTVPDSHLSLLEMVSRKDVAGSVATLIAHISDPCEQTVENWEQIMSGGTVE
jgi:DNA-binding GntR family transcriptional regulator